MQLRHAIRVLVVACVVLLGACKSAASPQTATPSAGPTELATFAGGCFWCVEAGFEEVPGVVSAVSGFSGGDSTNPSYEDVANHKTNHLEVVQITFDPTRVSYAELLETFWRMIDPTDAGGSFVDRGHQYTSAIFFHDPRQEALARYSKQLIEDRKLFAKPVATAIRPYQAFYPADAYHQDFYKKSTAHYKRYRAGSGRDPFIAATWHPVPPLFPRYGRPPVDALKQRLTPEQWRVTQENGTEPPFENAYFNSKQPGIYVDVASGEPLFASSHKFDSGTGWPSFTRPLVPSHVVEKTDTSHGTRRVEVRSRYGDSHLGHVFEDGPPPTGLRYCINSAALRFVPAAELAKEGYGQFAYLFP